MKRCAALLLYPVRESNASLILRRDSFYPSELTRLFSDLFSDREYRKKTAIHQAKGPKRPTSRYNFGNPQVLGAIPEFEL